MKLKPQIALPLAAVIFVASVWVLLIFLLGLPAAGLFSNPDSMRELFISAGNWGLPAATIVIAVCVALCWWFHDQICEVVLRGVLADPSEHPSYYATVGELADKAGLAMPRLSLISTADAGTPAVASAINPKRAMIGADPMLWEILTDEEIRGVLAHELGHIAKREWVPSTEHELAADRYSAELIGSGEPLASALEKIAANRDKLCGNRPAGLPSLLKSNPIMQPIHPPTAERARLLRQADQAVS